MYFVKNGDSVKINVEILHKIFLLPTTMDITQPVGTTLESIDFGVLSSDDILRLSVKQVVSPEVFDNLGHPVSGGLYDLALGAYGRNLCTTCGLDDRRCPGHTGHIELPIPLYNVMFFSTLFLLLRSTCVYCHHFRLKHSEKTLFIGKLRLIQYGLILEASNLEDIPADERSNWVNKCIDSAVSSGAVSAGGVRSPTLNEERKNLIKDFYRLMLSRPRCESCGMYSPRFRKDGTTKLFECALTEKQIKHNQAKGVERPPIPLDEKATSEMMSLPRAKYQNGHRFLPSMEVCQLIRRVMVNESKLASVLFQVRPTKSTYISGDIFFVHRLFVPPTRFRLPSELGDEVHMNPMTEQLAKVLTTCHRIKDLSDEILGLRNAKISGNERKTALTQLLGQLVQLQSDYTAVIDSSKVASVGGPPLPGVKQTLERKEGLFRKNMMGKRVNFAARSVISPDPNLETNEIGVPPVFAVRLTYPEPVTAHNAEELRQSVINGPDVWPGATMIQNEDGRSVSLHGMSLEHRTALASQLQTPPSNPRLRGVPKRVHRHIKNSDVVLMNRQPTLHKASMMGHKVRVLPKEKTLRLHYANTGAYNADFDGDEMNMHFPQNESARAEAFLLANTNNQYLTPTSGKPLRGLIQDHISAGLWLTNKDTMFDREGYQQLVYGAVRPETGQFASERVLLVPPAIVKPVPRWTGKQVITTILLNVKPSGRPGLNLKVNNKVKGDYWGAPGVEEQTVTVHNGELVTGTLDKSQYGAADYGLVHAIYEIYGPDTTGLLLSVLGRLFTKYIMHIAFTCGMDDLRLTRDGDTWRQDLLAQSESVGLQAALEVAQMPPDTEPNSPEFRKRLEEILRDDSKLSILDAITQTKASAMTTSVVQRCIPAGTAKKFPYNSMQAMALSGAKGSNVNVSQIMCALGQQALEGRRVPVMVSGKSLPSFKPFETHVRAGGYIGGRFYSGIRPQEYYFHCMAGREGLIDTAVKTSRSGYLQRCLIKQLEGVHSEYDNTVRDFDGTLVQFMYGGDSIDTTKESYLRQFEFCALNQEALLHKHSPQGDIANINDSSAPAYAKKMRKHLKKHPDSTKYEPVLSKFNPAKYLGAVSEGYSKELEAFIESREDLFSSKSSKAEFRTLMQLKFQQSLVDPGENVGVVASQSIGEPSTQMTLNTFHFAGHGAANVTLGIPRMREIIMTASAKIKTPQMVLPLRSDISDKDADIFAKGITRIMLSQLVDKVVVTERLGPNDFNQFVRSYEVRVQLFSRGEYESEYDVPMHEVERVLANNFLSLLEETVKKEQRKQRRANVGQALAPVAEKPTSSNNADQSSDSEESDNDDAEEDDSKQKQDHGIVEDEAEEASESEEESEDGEDVEDTDTGKERKDEAKTPEKSKSHNTRAQAVSGEHQTVNNFTFDDEEGKWCRFELEYPANSQKLLMVQLIENVCRRVVVREIPNITRGLRPPNHKGGRVLVTEGVNFGAMWDEELFVDVDGITSNDVAAVLHTYGVEAARATIVREVMNVFQTYAISVNHRHLELIADMMTREGTFLPFSRQGLDSGSSPLLKMSFESTCQFLTRAVLDGGYDSLESPSARIVVGRPFAGGTGAFDVLCPA